MIKYEANKSKGKITLTVEGSLMDLLQESLALISLIYERMQNESPEEAARFKKIVRVAINDDSGPMWLNTYEEETREDD